MVASLIPYSVPFHLLAINLFFQILELLFIEVFTIFPILKFADELNLQAKCLYSNLYNKHKQLISLDCI
jgi:hypothetical protein